MTPITHEYIDQILSNPHMVVDSVTWRRIVEWQRHSIELQNEIIESYAETS